MKFLYAKKKNFPCKRGDGDIHRGEIFVRASYQNRETGVWYGFNYHPNCYLIEFERRFVQSLLHWKEKLIPPKKLGRPLKTNNPKEHRRLKSLRYYYMKAGDESKVKELQTKIKTLEDKYNP